MFPTSSLNPNRNRSKDTRTLPEPQAPAPLPGILARIVETKEEELRRLRPREDVLRHAAEAAPAPRDFRAALARPGSVSLIAECKRRSPGAGRIRPDLDVARLAEGYSASGAAALSVLTDETYFGGSLADLRSARDSVTIPVLRKDFTLEPVHVLEARAAGADAVLLIVRILTDATLVELIGAAHDLGMATLVEAHDRDELERALGAGAEIVGINNRDLATFTTDLETTVRLLDEVPPDRLVVSESGIRNVDDVRLLGAAGVDAILVGETLLRASDPALAAASLCGVPTARRVATGGD
jgi:indole-3-glycerol phosphate synthase